MTQKIVGELGGCRKSLLEYKKFDNLNWGVGARVGCDCQQFRRSLRARFMWPTWGTSGADRTQVDPMLAP